MRTSCMPPLGTMYRQIKQIFGIAFGWPHRVVVDRQQLTFLCAAVERAIVIAEDDIL